MHVKIEIRTILYEDMHVKVGPKKLIRVSSFQKVQNSFKDMHVKIEIRTILSKRSIHPH